MELWEEQFTVRSFDVGSNSRLTPIALLAWLLDAAGQHAAQLGWGIHGLQRRGITWMLSRVQLEIAALPGWGEAVTVRTWPSGMERLFALRDFQVLSKDNAVLARATSAWLLLDLATRRPQRPTPELRRLATFPPTGRAYGSRRPLPELGVTTQGATFTARPFDVDLNGHVTAATLARWVLETLPADLLLENQLHSLELEFLAEVLLGEEVVGEYQRQGEQTLHRLRRTRDGREAVRGRSRLVGR